MSVRIRVGTTIDAPPATVWADIERLESHVEWMHDAGSIRFVGLRRHGVGTRSRAGRASDRSRPST